MWSVVTTAAVSVLWGAAATFALAAAAELGRYVLLLYSRIDLIPAWLVGLSDATTTVLGVAAPLVALAAAVRCVLWLIHTRRERFAMAGWSDPRSPRAIALLCLVPVVNVIFPAVLLTELVGLGSRADPDRLRLRRAVRVWCAGWLIGAAMSVVGLLFHLANSVQAQANGVGFTVVTDVVAAAVAVATVWVIRENDGLDLRGRPRRVARRWVATGAAQQVIAPIRAASDPLDAMDGPGDDIVVAS